MTFDHKNNQTAIGIKMPEKDRKPVEQPQIDNSSNMILVIIIVVTLSISFSMIGIGVYYICLKKKQEKMIMDGNTKTIFTQDGHQFDFGDDVEVVDATTKNG